MSTLSGKLALPRGGRPSLGRFIWVNALLAALVAGLGVVAYLNVGTTQTAAPAVRTTTVTRGVVLSTVSASGNLQAPQELALGFDTSGALTALYVRPGRRVKAGQLLARIDASQAKQAVAQAEAGLASATAQLQQTVTGETAAQRRQDALTLAQADAQVGAAKAALAAQRQTAAQNATSYASAVKQAQTQLRTDRGNLKGTVAKLHADQAQLAADQAAYDQARAVVASDQAVVANDQSEQQRVALGLLDAQQRQTTDKSISTTPPSVLADDAASVASWQREQQQLSFQLSQDQAKLSTDTATMNTASSAVGTDEAAVKSDQSTIVSLEAKIVQDRNALASAEQSRTAGLAKDRQAIETAQRQVVSAQQSRSATAVANQIKQAPPLASTVAQQRAAVLQAEATLADARRTLAQTALRAPIAGTISAVGGIVGQQVSGSGNSSVASSSASSSGGGSSAGSGLITLTDLSGMEVVAPFSETDAAKLRAGQPATVTVAALGSTKLAAHVVSIDTTSTVSSGVVTYNVTFALDRSNPQLKPGMTADVDVVVAERDNVLNVSTAALRGSGANATVTVLENGRQSTVPVVTGLQGDSTTEIVSGLSNGQTIVLPSVAISSLTGTSGAGSTTTPSGRNGGRFGGGFGGFGGLGG